MCLQTYWMVRNFTRGLLIAGLFWGPLTLGPVQAQDTQPASSATTLDEPETAPGEQHKSAEQTDTSAQAPPNTSPAADNDPLAQRRAQASEVYEELARAYLANDWGSLKDQLKIIRRHMRNLDRQQRMDISYIRKSANDFQPKWWHKCSSSSNISFQAELWNRPLTANYTPTNSTLGVQRVETEGRYRKNRRGQYEWRVTKLNVIVSWKPNLVNSDSPATGRLAEIHGSRLGDLGELIVWHELGHGYITNYLPLEHVVTLYTDHAMLFSHLQEFYADVTALYHTSPRARRTVLMFRLQGLDYYDESEQHDRAAHAVGALVLHNILAKPDDWPSFHFPPAVPKQQVELNTIIYLYEHMDPDWSVKEARALRELAQNFIKRSGEKTLRARGVLPLPNKLKFSLMAGQDHKLQARRDTFVTQRLEALIASGRADTLEEDQTYDPPLRRMDRSGRHHNDDDGEPLRIDIPM